MRLDNLAKPIDTLINKISDAVGGIAKPWQIKRIAKAEAEADRTTELFGVETAHLKQRAIEHFTNEEIMKQSNMESIINQSSTQLNNNAKPEQMDNDWIAYFFDRCRIVSDEKMQMIWAKILAGEANVPGTYSKRTVNFMESLDKNDAELFTKLCAFTVVRPNAGLFPLIYQTESEIDEIYVQNGVGFSVLKHLEDIGLINLQTLTGYVLHKLQQSVIIIHGDVPYLLKFQNEKDNK